MNYLPKRFEDRAAPLRRHMNWGMGIITFLLGLGLFKTEVDRIISMPRSVVNILYLALFGATLLLTGGWMAVSNKELSILCEWFDPKEYELPDGFLISPLVALALIALLVAARNAVWFGVLYTIYTTLNLVAVLYFNTQLKTALVRSRIRLAEDRPVAVAVYEDALNVIESYYVVRPNTGRVISTLILSVVGLTLSCIALGHRSGWIEPAAYIIYLLSIALFEGIVAFSWRAKFYRQIHDLNAVRCELER